MTVIKKGLNVVGNGLHIIDALPGMIMGEYYMNEYCDEVIELYVEHYKKNANSNTLSYQEAIDYFEKTSK